jgi:hypothetical protein
MDQLEQAIIDAVEHGAPPKVWAVPETAEVQFGDGPDPFNGILICGWVA